MTDIVLDTLFDGKDTATPEGLARYRARYAQEHRGFAMPEIRYQSIYAPLFKSINTVADFDKLNLEALAFAADMKPDEFKKFITKVWITEAIMKSTPLEIRIGTKDDYTTYPVATPEYHSRSGPLFLGLFEPDVGKDYQTPHVPSAQAEAIYDRAIERTRAKFGATANYNENHVKAVASLYTTVRHPNQRGFSDADLFSKSKKPFIDSVKSAIQQHLQKNSITDLTINDDLYVAIGEFAFEVGGYIDIDLIRRVAADTTLDYKAEAKKAMPSSEADIKTCFYHPLLAITPAMRAAGVIGTVRLDLLYGTGIAFWDNDGKGHQTEMGDFVCDQSSLYADIFSQQHAAGNITKETLARDYILVEECTKKITNMTVQPEGKAAGNMSDVTTILYNLFCNDTDLPNKAILQDVAKLSTLLGIVRWNPQNIHSDFGTKTFFKGSHQSMYHDSIQGRTPQGDSGFRKDMGWVRDNAAYANHELGQFSEAITPIKAFLRSAEAEAFISHIRHVRDSFKAYDEKTSSSNSLISNSPLFAKRASAEAQRDLHSIKQHTTLFADRLVELLNTPALSNLKQAILDFTSAAERSTAIQNFAQQAAENFITSIRFGQTRENRVSNPTAANFARTVPSGHVARLRASLPDNFGGIASKPDMPRNSSDSALLRSNRSYGARQAVISRTLDPRVTRSDKAPRNSDRIPPVFPRG